VTVYGHEQPLVCLLLEGGQLGRPLPARVRTESLAQHVDGKLARGHGL
jgi:hypothetical protein